NDGAVRAAGSFGISRNGVDQAQIKIDAEEIAWRYPDGIRALLSGNFNLTGSQPRLLLNGSIDVVHAVYTKDIDITKDIFKNLLNTEVVEAQPVSEFLRQVVLDVDIRLGETLIANNRAQLQLGGLLHARGSLAVPVVTGNLTILEGGKVYIDSSRNRPY